MNSLYTAEGVMDKHSLWQRYVPLVRHEAYQEELNLKEIGAVLEVGESRVSQLHSQAIKRLRTKLGKL